VWSFDVVVGHAWKVLPLGIIGAVVLPARGVDDDVDGSTVVDDWGGGMSMRSNIFWVARQIMAIRVDGGWIYWV